jgi:hypothetical protein
MTLRVVQWATGAVGRHAIRGILRHPALELAGAYVRDPAKAGRDAGELAGIGPIGIAATGDVDALLDLRPDCIHYAPLYPDIDLLCRMLERGIDVVSPCGFWFPEAHPKLEARLAAACEKGGSSLHGSGIHPGITEPLVLLLSSLSLSVDRVLVQEVADLRDHPSHEQMFEGAGFGREPEECSSRPSPISRGMAGAFRESQALVAAGLGLAVEGFEFDYEVAVTPLRLEVAAGVIEPGRVAGMRWEFRSLVAGRPRIVYRTFWRMSEGLEPDWGFETLRYSVEVQGEPNLRLEFDPTLEVESDAPWSRSPEEAGLVCTAMNGVNAIPALCAAPPGLRTILDLGLLRGGAIGSAPGARDPQ